MGAQQPESAHSSGQQQQRKEGPTPSGWWPQQTSICL